MISIDQLLAIKSLVGSEAPRWMPDGDRIVFASGLGGGVDLWSIAPEGGSPTRLSVGMGSVGHLAYFMYTPSPDGKHIAYVSQKGGAYEVWLWNADGEPDRQLTRLGGAIESLAWAPDSSAVVISANRYGVYDIYLADVPSGETRRLTSDPHYEVYATFTPDSQEILFVRLDDRWVDHEIVRMDRDGGNQRVIGTDENFFDYHYGRTFGYPTASPDGSQIFFRSHRSGWINYWAIGPDGGEPRQLSPQEADQEGGAWSPDGEWFAFVSNTNGTTDVRIVPAAGGDAKVLVAPDMGVCAHPQWSPDGKTISFALATPSCSGRSLRRRCRQWRRHAPDRLLDWKHGVRACDTRKGLISELRWRNDPCLSLPPEIDRRRSEWRRDRLGAWWPHKPVYGHAPATSTVFRPAWLYGHLAEHPRFVGVQSPFRRFEQRRLGSW